MTWLKCFNRIMLKYQRIAVQKPKQNNINYCYSATTPDGVAVASVNQIPSLTETNGTLMNSWPRNTLRIEFKTNASICDPCRETRKNKTLFCKCCGKKLRKKSPESENVLNYAQASKDKLINGRSAINGNIYKNSTFKSNSIKLVKKSHQHLKKSKAMIDIKMKQNKTRCRKRSMSLTKTNVSQLIRAEKRLKVASFVSSTLIENKQSNVNYNNNKSDDVKLVLQKSSFVVDFSSTPIKIAPKTSTPIKRLF